MFEELFLEGSGPDGKGIVNFWKRGSEFLEVEIDYKFYFTTLI